MPYKGRRKYNNRKRNNRRKNGAVSRYRGTVARIPRPLAIKPKSVCQKLVYYNSFHCIPALNPVSSTQQNWYFTIALNSPWPFIYQWDQGAQANAKQIVANSTITSLDTNANPTATTTAMPGLKDGYNLFHQYQNGLVVGTKVVLSAQPTGRADSSGAEQSGVLYAVKHAKVSFGLTSDSTITDIQKLPFRKMKRIAGPATPSTMYERNTGAYMVINHSPKKFNNVQSLRDNERFQFKQASGALPNGQAPVDNDFLTVGCVPALNNFQVAGVSQARKTCDFKLSMRIEQTILFTEPLENLSEGTGAYSLPWDARKYGGPGYTFTKMMNF